MNWPPDVALRPIVSWPGEQTRNRRYATFRFIAVTEAEKILTGARA